MPAVALVGAGLSIASGIAAGAATLIGGLQIAGGVLAAAGAVTGNKKLTALGSLMGIGAGVANAMSSAGNAAGAVDGVAESASGLGEAVDATGGLETATNYAYKPSGLAAMAFDGETSGVMENLGGASPLDTKSGEVNLATADPERVTAAVKQANVNTDTKTPTDFETGFEGQVKTEQPQQSADFKTGFEGQVKQGPKSELGTTNKAKGMMAEVMDFIQNPKNAGVLKVGGGLVAGAMKGISDQSLMKQKAALDEEIKARERERLNKSITGMARFA